MPEGSQRSQMAVIDRKHLTAHIAQRRIPPAKIERCSEISGAID
ncbi:hypothetical protein FHS26_003147 [Rhizobium pisi]|uniref:Uncharacterized protein n=1 Tax=Rhizobium pisi TaxID=574561 RepID=A0A7W5BM22_9HYPH|nr:hypothetical protein [Rhizobium pisi]